jgi:hypothetical protein
MELIFKELEISKNVELQQLCRTLGISDTPLVDLGRETLLAALALEFKREGIVEVLDQFGRPRLTLEEPTS